MFETSVIHPEVVAERRVGLLSLSFGVHAFVVVAILAASIRTIEFPTRAPNEYATPLIARPVQMPPPALGRPDGGHKQATPAAPAKEKPAPSANTTPALIPEHVVPALATNTTTSDAPATTGTGSDVPVGVPDGVKDGIGIAGPPGVVTAAVDDNIPLAITGDVRPPVVIRRVSPPYPRAALAARMNGSVIVECIIDRNGHVRDARVLHSTSTLFDQAAVDAVLQWQFAPGSLHGRAVDTIFDLTVTFKVTS